MLPPEVVTELREQWFPHVTDAGLARLIELLERGSRLLVQGRFVAAVPQGCLATHIAWNHPQAALWGDEAGVRWLTKIAGLNPATSRVLRWWDETGSVPWPLGNDLLDELTAERDRRRSSTPQRMVASA